MLGGRGIYRQADGIGTVSVEARAVWPWPGRGPAPAPPLAPGGLCASHGRHAPMLASPRPLPLPAVGSARANFFIIKKYQKASDTNFFIIKGEKKKRSDTN